MNQTATGMSKGNGSGRNRTRITNGGTLRGILLWCVLLSGSWFLAGAQETRQEEPRGPVATLLYADNLDEITVLDFTGTPIEDIYFGAPLLIGFGLETGGSGVELQLSANGTIMYVGPRTFLKIEELQGLADTRTNTVAVVRGTVRTVAASVSRQNHRIHTPSAAFGVRGTDFVVTVDADGSAELAVAAGVVAAFDPFSGTRAETAPGDVLSVRGGVLQRMEREQDEVARRVAQAQFSTADPTRVPRTTDPGYRNPFDYFQDLEAEAYRAWFARDNFFDDYREFMERFRSYYEAEMATFQEVLQREREAVERRQQEGRDAIQGDQDAFRRWQEGRQQERRSPEGRR